MSKPLLRLTEKSSNSDTKCMEFFFDSLNMKRPSSKPLSQLDINPVTWILSTLPSFSASLKLNEKDAPKKRIGNNLNLILHKSCKRMTLLPLNIAQKFESTLESFGNLVQHSKNPQFQSAHSSDLLLFESLKEYPITLNAPDYKYGPLEL